MHKNPVKHKTGQVKKNLLYVGLDFSDSKPTYFVQNALKFDGSTGTEKVPCL